MEDINLFARAVRTVVRECFLESPTCKFAALASVSADRRAKTRECTGGRLQWQWRCCESGGTTS